MICKFFLNELKLKLNRRKAVRVKGGVSVGLRSVCAKLNFDAVAPKSPTHLHTRSQITIAPKYKKQKPNSNPYTKATSARCTYATWPKIENEKRIAKKGPFFIFAILYISVRHRH